MSVKKNAQDKVRICIAALLCGYYLCSAYSTWVWFIHIHLTDRYNFRHIFFYIYVRFSYKISINNIRGCYDFINQCIYNETDVNRFISDLLPELWDEALLGLWDSVFGESGRTTLEKRKMFSISFMWIMTPL